MRQPPDLEEQLLVKHAKTSSSVNDACSLKRIFCTKHESARTGISTIVWTATIIIEETCEEPSLNSKEGSNASIPKAIIPTASTKPATTTPASPSVPNIFPAIRCAVKCL